LFIAIATITGLLASLNERKLQKIKGSRASLCARLGAPALPAQRWQWVIFNTAKVHIDYHAEVDFHRYSGPHSRVGLALQARITDARSRASRCECTSLQTQGMHPAHLSNPPVVRPSRSKQFVRPNTIKKSKTKCKALRFMLASPARSCTSRRRFSPSAEIFH